MSTRGRFKAFLNSFLGKLAFQLNRMWFMMVAIIKSNPEPSELRAHGSFQLNFVTVRMPRDQFYNGTKWFNQSLYRQVHSSRTFSFTYYPVPTLHLRR